MEFPTKDDHDAFFAFRCVDERMNGASYNTLQHATLLRLVPAASHLAEGTCSHEFV